jgi:hypothetical protein
MLAEMLTYYDYRRLTRRSQTKAEETVRYLQIEFPSTLNVFGNENIKIDYYVGRVDQVDESRPISATDGGHSAGFPNAIDRVWGPPPYERRRPTVLMLPISGGIDFSVESFARLFVARGINCALVHNRKVRIRATQSAEEVEAYFRQTVLDNRQALDYLVTRADVDPNRLGCLGLSLGGIKTSLVAAVDRRIQCAVLGLTGGNADITMHQKSGIEGTSANCWRLGVEPADSRGEGRCHRSAAAEPILDAQDAPVHRRFTAVPT